MPITLQNLKLSLEEDLEAALSRECPGWTSFRILRQSVDARTRHKPHFVMTVEVALNGEVLPKLSFHFPKRNLKPGGERPIIVGSGPGGLFAAIRLVEQGIPCILFEQGSPAEVRIQKINRFWRYNELDERNNVCFGEGGAGLYSDGKLITRIKSPHIPYVLDRMVQFGAPGEIAYLANPHVGSDRIRKLIPVMRAFLQSSGCEIRYDTKISELVLTNNLCQGVVTDKNEKFFSQSVVLATGHSAEDILEHLQDKNVRMEGKSYAVGVRVEHPQPLINKIQFREAASHPKLGSANYKITYHDHASHIGVYSFCMCPGGYVLSSGTKEHRLVSNGMSNFARNSPFANAAVVVTVEHDKISEGKIWGGMNFRKHLEVSAYELIKNKQSGSALPAQKLHDFLNGMASGDLRKGSSPSGASTARVDTLFPSWMMGSLTKAFETWEKQMPGFISNEAVVYGVESRTSCPVRILRSPENLQSLSHAGLYPCGEGAGYAGGITSAACDGVEIADQIIAEVCS